jgi:thiol-disulfide isomerase/thioredoxin
MKELTTTQAFYEAIKNDQYLMVYFYTSTCPDCFSVKPFLPRLESDYEGVMDLAAFNRNVSMDVYRELDIFGIPSFIIFKNGVEVGRLISRVKKSYLEVKAFIESTIKEG